MRKENIAAIYPCDLTDIESQVFKNGLLKPMPHSFYEGIELNALRYFMYVHALYTLPTTELISFLKQHIQGTAIEIGAGADCIFDALGIKGTDSKQQECKEVIDFYNKIKQPVIKYPPSVEKMSALEAIKKYKPDTVIGSFITHKWNGVSGNPDGVQEEIILKKISRYILIGNEVTHHDKPILRYAKHTVHNYPWLITRGIDSSRNRIWIFDK